MVRPQSIWYIHLVETMCSSNSPRMNKELENVGEAKSSTNILITLIPTCIMRKPPLWGRCQTFSGSWGYHRDESSWKSVKQLVQMLLDTVSKGGNFLLNVGQTARGECDRRAIDRLSDIVTWMSARLMALHAYPRNSKLHLKTDFTRQCIRHP